ncbi:hypothetical+protein [Methylocapsa aurea]|uniref:methyltransferase domain-containing protein n=1 Tax=Methylocapsa aurea TaxID=663610 RepID=UPI003D18C8C2
MSEQVLTAEAVRAAYLLLLAREPESEAIVQNYVDHSNFDKLKDIILGSREFVARALQEDFVTNLPFFAAMHVDNLNSSMRGTEHLAILDLPISGKTVSDIGAGLGLMASFFFERKCKVNLVDKSESLIELAKIYHSSSRERDLSNLSFVVADFDSLEAPKLEQTAITICYDTLWQSKNIRSFIENLNTVTGEILVLETRAAFGIHDDLFVYLDTVSTHDGPTMVNIPTRPWLANRLGEYFPHVYQPTIQPRHCDFPNSWDLPLRNGAQYGRTVFIASRKEIDTPRLKLFR